MKAVNAVRSPRGYEALFAVERLQEMRSSGICNGRIVVAIYGGSTRRMSNFLHMGAEVRMTRRTWSS